MSCFWYVVYNRLCSSFYNRFKLGDMIVERVVVDAVAVLHLEEGVLYLDHAVLQGPVRVAEPPAGVLHLHLPTLQVQPEGLLTRRHEQRAWIQFIIHPEKIDALVSKLRYSILS